MLAERGVYRLTRHPVFMGTSVMALAHSVASSHATNVAFFGGHAVFALLSWAGVLLNPSKGSISSAWRPTRCSIAALFASYCCSRSAAYPSRLVSHGEVIPERVRRSIGAQLAIGADALLTYAARRRIRQKELEALRTTCGYRMFTGLRWSAASDERAGLEPRKRLAELDHR